MGKGKKIFSRPCPVSRHRWAHAGGQSRGMLRGGGGGEPRRTEGSRRESCVVGGVGPGGRELQHSV